MAGVQVDRQQHIDTTPREFSRRSVAAVGIFSNGRLYENLGESNARPTRKREYEVGVNYYISQRYYAGISYFRHWQVNDANDRFAMAKVKFWVNF